MQVCCALQRSYVFTWKGWCKHPKVHSARCRHPSFSQETFRYQCSKVAHWTADGRPTRRLRPLHTMVSQMLAIIARSCALSQVMLALMLQHIGWTAMTAGSPSPARISQRDSWLGSHVFGCAARISSSCMTGTSRPMPPRQTPRCCTC